MRKFELKKEHIDLMSNLNFKTVVNTVYDDIYAPAIDRKRPFGNSGTTSSALEILGYSCDEEGEYNEKDIDIAETLLVELPVALEIVMRNKTFKPGIYEVDEYSAYFNYTHVRNYKILRKPLEEIEDTCVITTDDAESMERMHEVCLNVSGDDPYKVIEDLKWFNQTRFLEEAILIFEKYKPKE